ncbi:MAG: hypothetical protein AAGG02_15505 [Cyanobacteria bacterium P01_H01_bin.15]
MKIPVFVSSPTKLNKNQNKVREALFILLNTFGLEPRALGQSDYPTQLPLREVLTVAKHCSGGIILGFEQQFAPKIEKYRGIPDPQNNNTIKDISYSTPWNHIEAGILFALGIPQLIFREPGITGGVFDNGVSDVFVHPMPAINSNDGTLDTQVNQTILKWQAQVRTHYYR